MSEQNSLSNQFDADNLTNLTNSTDTVDTADNANSTNSSEPDKKVSALSALSTFSVDEMSRLLSLANTSETRSKYFSSTNSHTRTKPVRRNAIYHHNPMGSNGLPTQMGSMNAWFQSPPPIIPPQSSQSSQPSQFFSAPVPASMTAAENEWFDIQPDPSVNSPVLNNPNPDIFLGPSTVPPLPAPHTLVSPWINSSIVPDNEAGVEPDDNVSDLDINENDDALDINENDDALDINENEDALDVNENEDIFE